MAYGPGTPSPPADPWAGAARSSMRQAASTPPRGWLTTRRPRTSSDPVAPRPDGARPRRAPLPPDVTATAASAVAGRNGQPRIIAISSPWVSSSAAATRPRPPGPIGAPARSVTTQPAARHRAMPAEKCSDSVREPPSVT